jgi:hypothetical protein
MSLSQRAPGIKGCEDLGGRNWGVFWPHREVRCWWGAQLGAESPTPALLFISADSWQRSGDRECPVWHCECSGWEVASPYQRLTKELLAHFYWCRRAQTETEKAPELLGSKFIKQASSNSVDLSPKTEPQNKGGFPYIPFRAGYRNGVGYSFSHT